jgi:hypothetical protein
LRKTKLGMVAQGCNSSTQEAKAGGSEFKASLDYIERFYLKKKTYKKKKGGGNKMLSLMN